MSSDAEPTTVPPCVSQPCRHKAYYFEDQHIIFRVEDDLYRVHSHFLTAHSPVFRDMLSLEAPPCEVPEGRSDEKPIVLKQVKSCDFQRLLWMFYNPKINDFCASQEEWFSILALADLWEMDTIRNVAIEALGRCTLPDVDRIVMCRKYDIKREWAVEALMNVCAREAPLSVAEGIKFGVELSVEIAEARERIIKERETILTSISQSRPGTPARGWAGPGRGLTSPLCTFSGSSERLGGLEKVRVKEIVMDTFVHRPDPVIRAC